MLESIQGNTFEYEKLSPEEMQKRGILGRLKGILADYRRPTRNGRLYGEALWDKVFNDEITKEKIANRTVFGELEHPSDGREAIDPEKIAVCLAEQPKKDKDGHLVGVFDVLNTPCGNILKTLLDYGTTVGVSSRGSGDTFMNSKGMEEVDPDSYSFTGFDVVLLPAVKEARMAAVNESLGSKTLNQALVESIDKADEKDKKVMREALDDLGIKLDNNSNQTEEVDNIDATIEDDSADNDGDSIVEELQNALLKVQELQGKVGSLQEKLSVCYAKEFDLEEEIERHKKTISKLTESVKSVEPLKKRINTLTEELDSKSNQATESKSELEESSNKVRSLTKQNRSLRDSIKDKDQLIESLKERLSSVNEQSSSDISSLESKVESLTEELRDAKKDSALKHREYQSKLERQNQLVEKYKTIAKTAVNKYMESQANKLGVSVNEIRNKLSESYTFNDIDRVCEDIQENRLGLNSLPFSMPFERGSKVRITESIDTTVPVNEDDVIDDTLRSLANI